MQKHRHWLLISLILFGTSVGLIGATARSQAKTVNGSSICSAVPTVSPAGAGEPDGGQTGKTVTKSVSRPPDPRRTPSGLSTWLGWISRIWIVRLLRFGY